ncbi:unnamed protein product [Caenorhabditis brenneri]
MTSWILFLISLFPITNSEMKMMVVYGIPESEKDAIVNNTLTWDECLQNCYYDPECVMAWQSNDTCLIYKYFGMSPVTKTSSVNESIVAFKVNSPDNECPIGSNPPTFNNANATGMLYVNEYPPYWPLYVKYDIYLDGDTWKYSYSVNRSCKGSYQHVIQYSNNSGLCVTTWWANDGGSFAYNRAVELCKNKTSYLARLVEKEDFAWFEQKGQNLRQSLYSPDSYARIDGVRSAKCRSTPKTAECMSAKGFSFNGPPVPHFNNYKWVTNSAAMATADDNCLVMVFKGNGAVQVDVKGCKETTPLKSGMVFCSKSAWI